ncbi:zinc-binding dehydrogenase [Bacillus sp. 28A-2]|uniref:zinc-dependent alcohol dehydrogenase n=1 Tax=Bacillus sp. 28A-2 TaxID=2772252 RepID=UPI00168D8432|nr:zinc-binding dehydrogenase [Bacillus sp. 28A-2]MBD3861610.1 zinc-binding dehydrogenase [Bacillus sp. 28A-2]
MHEKKPKRTILNSKMLAVQKLEPRKAIFQQTEIPLIGPDELLLKVIYSGVCTTDLHVLYHDMGKREFPFTMGHELSAVVAEVGGKVKYYPGTVKEIQIGDRVTVEPLLPCKDCDPCRTGRHNLCGNMSHLGIFDDGAYAEYVKVPADRTHCLPPDVSSLAGVFVEPLACAINFIDRSQMKPGQTVLILGGGSIGQMALQVAKASGGEVIVSEPIEKKRRLATTLGAKAVLDPLHEDLYERVMDLTNNKGADVVIECVGTSATVSQMLKMVKRGGRCVLGGAPMKAITMDFLPLWYGEIELVAAHATAWQFPRALKLLEMGLINVDAVIEEILPLEQAVSAFEQVYNSNEIQKIIFRHE